MPEAGSVRWRQGRGDGETSCLGSGRGGSGARRAGDGRGSVRGPAQEALVEKADAAVAVERFDYLYAGQQVDLAPGRRMVLSYLRSCWRESILGGKVTVGREESKVAGGKVERVRLKCSAGALRLRAEEGQHAAVMVFRAPAEAEGHRTRALGRKIIVRRVLFDTSPIIELPGGGRVRIERVDRPGERLVIDVPHGRSYATSRYDMAAAHQSLAAGGIYRAKTFAHSVLFGVHATAAPGAAPAIGRLLRLAP